MLLSGPRDHRGPAVQGDATIKGAVRGGGLVGEVMPSRVNLYIFGWTCLALLALVPAVVITLVLRPFSSSPPASDCLAGSIVVAGSTAFAPTQLLQAVNEISGAIGYAESAQASQYPHIEQVQLDGATASPGSARTRPRASCRVPTTRRSPAA